MSRTYRQGYNKFKDKMTKHSSSNHIAKIVKCLKTNEQNYNRAIELSKYIYSIPNCDEHSLLAKLKELKTQTNDNTNYSDIP